MTPTLRAGDSPARLRRPGVRRYLGDADGHLAEWLELYDATFTGPPWNEPRRDVEAYRERIGWHLDHPDLEIWEARDAHGRLCGLAYGWPTTGPWPETPFYGALASGLGPERTTWLVKAATFEVVELMVRPDAQGSGLGRLLLARLSDDERVTWLVTHRDSGAVGFYCHLGWCHFGAFTTASGVPLDVMVQDKSPSG